MDYKYATRRRGNRKRIRQCHVNAWKSYAKKSLTSLKSLANDCFFVVAIVIVIGIISRFVTPLFFEYRLDNGGISIYSNTPIPSSYGKIANKVKEKLAESMYYDRRLPLRIFLCDSQWRFSLLRHFSSNAVGYYKPVSDNIFIDKERMESSRELMTVAVHEATHAMLCNSLGRIRFCLLPKWVSEGYAEYVAYPRIKSSDISMMVYCLNLMEADKSVKSYQRYHLLVAYLLDVKKIPIESIVKAPPSQKELESLEMELGLRRRPTT